MESPRFRDVRDRLDARSRSSRRFPPNDWSVDEVEHRLVRASVEWAYVFDPHGHQLLRRRGSPTTVSFEAADIPLLKDAIVVHNHPLLPGERAEELTVSLTDLVFAVRYDVAELRVVTAGWSGAITRPPNGWPVDEEIMAQAYEETRREVIGLLNVAVLDGRLTPADVQRLLAHETMRRIAGWGGFGYRWQSSRSTDR